jgi:hypothetical protein
VTASSRIGCPGKAAQIPEEGNGSLERERQRAGWGGERPGEQGQCQEHTQSKSWHQNVRKNSTHKESSQEKSHIQEQGLLAGSNCQLARERWHSIDSGLGVTFIEVGA